MVATDGEQVAVSRDEPHFELRVGELDARGKGGRPAVDRVHAERIHVVRKTCCTPDAGDEHEIFPAFIQLGKRHLHRFENRVIPAAGTPANLLIGDKIFGLVRWQCYFSHSVSPLRMASDFSTMESTRSILPCISLMPMASMRNLSRINMRSWPMLISGMTTFL